MSANCPKCEQPRRDEDTACTRCGLVIARWATFRVEIPAHELLDPLWERLIGDWNDATLHARFIDEAAACEGLAVAAARYRSVAHRPDCREAALAGLARLAILAERLCSQAVWATRTRAPSGIWRAAAVALAVGFIAATGMFIKEVGACPREVAAQQVAAR